MRLYRYISLCLALCLATFSLIAQQDSTQVEKKFSKEDYGEAARHYEQLIQKRPTANAYYNLGVCHMQMDQLSSAIFNYERALLIDPTHTEARHNLRLAYAMSKDNLTDGRSLPWIDDICYALPSETIALISTVLFVLMLILFIGFRLGGSISVRRFSFYGALTCLFLWLLSGGIIAHQWYYHGKAERRAIVTAKRLAVQNTPGEGAKLVQEVHEGTALFMINDPLGVWQEVEFADGRHGWVPINGIIPVKLTKAYAL